MENNTPPEETTNQVRKILVRVAAICIVASILIRFFFSNPVGDRLSTSLKEAQMSEPQIKAIATAFDNEHDLLIETGSQLGLLLLLFRMAEKKFNKKL